MTWLGFQVRKMFKELLSSFANDIMGIAAICLAIVMVYQQYEEALPPPPGQIPPPPPPPPPGALSGLLQPSPPAAVVTQSDDSEEHPTDVSSWAELSSGSSSSIGERMVCPQDLFTDTGEAIRDTEAAPQPLRHYSHTRPQQLRKLQTHSIEPRLRLDSDPVDGFIEEVSRVRGRWKSFHRPPLE